MKPAVRTIEIGGRTHELRAPADLDAALVATTGCDAAETRDALAGNPLAGRVALALLPFLATLVDVIALATAIASDPGAVAQVAALYDEMPNALAPAEEGDA